MRVGPPPWQQPWGMVTGNFPPMLCTHLLPSAQGEHLERLATKNLCFLCVTVTQILDLLSLDKSAKLGIPTILLWCTLARWSRGIQNLLLKFWKTGIQGLCNARWNMLNTPVGRLHPGILQKRHNLVRVV